MESNFSTFRLNFSSDETCEFESPNFAQEERFFEDKYFGILSSQFNEEFDSDCLDKFIFSSAKPTLRLNSQLANPKFAKFIINNNSTKQKVYLEKEIDSSHSFKYDDTETDLKLKEVNELLSRKRNCSISKAEQKNLNKLVKEQLKMEKNRLSAKKSREKQKRRMEDLESINQQLLSENERLAIASQNYSNIISLYQNYFNKYICDSCSRNLPSEIRRLGLIDDSQSTDENDSSLFVSSQSENSQSTANKLTVITAIILIIVCLLSSFNSSIPNKPELSKARHLSSEAENLPDLPIQIGYKNEFREPPFNHPSNNSSLELK